MTGFAFPAQRLGEAAFARTGAQGTVAPGAVHRSVCAIERIGGHGIVIEITFGHAEGHLVMAPRTSFLAMETARHAWGIEAGPVWIAVAGRAALRVAREELADLAQAAAAVRSGMTSMAVGAVGVAMGVHQREAGPAVMIESRPAHVGEALLVVAAFAAFPPLHDTREFQGIEAREVGILVAVGAGGADDLLLGLVAVGAIDSAMHSLQLVSSPALVVEIRRQHRLEVDLVMAARTAATTRHFQRQVFAVEATLMRILMALRAVVHTGVLELRCETEATPLVSRRLEWEMAGTAFRLQVGATQGEAGPVRMVEARWEFRREAFGAVAGAAVAPARSVQEGPIVGTEMAGITARLRLGIDRTELVVSGRVEVAGGAFRLEMRAGQWEGGALVPLGVEERGREVQRVMAGGATLRCLVPIDELQLVRVVVTGQAIVGGTPGEACLEVLTLGMAGVAIEVMRGLQLEAGVDMSGSIEGLGRKGEVLAVQSVAGGAVLRAGAGALGRGGQEPFRMRRCVAIAAIAPCGRVVAAHGLDGVAGFLRVALQAADLVMHALQRETLVMLEGRHQFEGLALSMALGAALLHATFVRVLMTGHTVLGEAQIAKLPFLQCGQLAELMAFDALQLLMLAAQLPIEVAVVVSVAVLHSGGEETLRRDQGEGTSMMVAMAGTTGLGTKRLESAMQADALLQMLRNLFMAVEAGRRHVFRAIPVAGLAIGPSQQVRDLGMGRADLTRVGLPEVGDHQPHHQRDGDQGEGKPREGAFQNPGAVVMEE